jgi:hypothetical protein
MTARYQQGSLLRMKRNRQPDIWVFRHYANDAEGQRRYRKTLVGTLLQYPTRKDAEKAIASLRHNINEGAVAPLCCWRADCLLQSL